MNRGIGTFAKGIATGIATGIAVGSAVSMVTKPMDIRKRARMKKQATRALRAVGAVVSSAQNMIR